MLVPGAATMDLVQPLGAYAEEGFARLGPVLSEEGAARSLCTASRRSGRSQASC